MKIYQNRVKEGVHEQGEHAECQINQMVEQLKIGDDLAEVFRERALVAHYAHQVDALQKHLQDNHI